MLFGSARFGFGTARLASARLQSRLKTHVGSNARTQFGRPVASSVARLTHHETYLRPFVARFAVGKGTSPVDGQEPSQTAKTYKDVTIVYFCAHLFYNLNAQ